MCLTVVVIWVLTDDDDLDVVERRVTGPRGMLAVPTSQRAIRGSEAVRPYQE